MTSSCTSIIMFGSLLELSLFLSWIDPKPLLLRIDFENSLWMLLSWSTSLECSTLASRVWLAPRRYLRSIILMKLIKIINGNPIRSCWALLWKTQKTLQLPQTDDLGLAIPELSVRKVQAAIISHWIAMRLLHVYGRLIAIYEVNTAI
jgi:hypothetical protein